MKLKFWKRPAIDMSIESNFPDLTMKPGGSIRNRLRNFKIFRTQPVGRPKDIIASILIGLGIFSAETMAGTVVTIAGIVITGYTVTSIITAALIIGLSVWSMASTGGQRRAGGIGGGPGTIGGSTIEQNGQLVNTRQASKVLPVIYGVSRVDGNRIYPG